MDDHRHQMRVELGIDADESVAWLARSTDPGELRRSFRLALSTLYTWRNLEKGGRAGFRGDGARAETLEALMEMRGSYEHQLLTSPPGIVLGDLYPSDELYPSDNQYLWQARIRDDLDPLTWRTAEGKVMARAKLDAYELLKGRVVVELLEEASRFLRGLRTHG